MTEAEKRRLVALPIALALMVGLAWAGGQGGHEVGGIPLFSLCVALALAIQWIAFVPAYLAQTERFYDLTGSITYLTLVAVALLAGPPADVRTVLLATLVVVWAARLGSFLYLLFLNRGADNRRYRQ